MPKERRNREHKDFPRPYATANTTLRPSSNLITNSSTPILPPIHSIFTLAEELNNPSRKRIATDPTNLPPRSCPPSQIQQQPLSRSGITTPHTFSLTQQALQLQRQLQQQQLQQQHLQLQLQTRSQQRSISADNSFHNPSQLNYPPFQYSATSYQWSLFANTRPSNDTLKALLIQTLKPHGSYNKSLHLTDELNKPPQPK